MRHFNIYYRLYTAFIDQFTVQSQGPLYVCCSVNSRFPKKRRISIEERKHFISVRNIQNSGFEKKACVYPGTDRFLKCINKLMFVIIKSFLCCVDWILKYYIDEIRLQTVTFSPQRFRGKIEREKENGVGPLWWQSSLTRQNQRDKFVMMATLGRNV